MLNKIFLATACCLLPFYAHAEVLDKLPQVQDMWMHSVLGVLFAGVALRIHRAVFMLVLIYPAFWFVSLLMDVHLLIFSKVLSLNNILTLGLPKE